MSNILVSNELRELLLDQWVEEMTNSSIYISIGAWFKNKGFDNLGKMFLDGSKEEIGHAEQIVSLMTDLNIGFEPNMIAKVDSDWGIRKIAETFLAREIQTTDSLAEIKKMAIEQNASIVEEFSRKMIVQQQAEMEECLSFKDKVEIIGEDMRTLLLWDLSLGG